MNSCFCRLPLLLGTIFMSFLHDKSLVLDEDMGSCNVARECHSILYIDSLLARHPRQDLCLHRLSFRRIRVRSSYHGCESRDPDECAIRRGGELHIPSHGCLDRCPSCLAGVPGSYVVPVAGWRYCFLVSFNCLVAMSLRFAPAIPLTIICELPVFMVHELVPFWAQNLRQVDTMTQDSIGVTHIPPLSSQAA